MMRSRGGLAVSVAVALVALWLWLAGPQRVFGLDAGQVGRVALAAAAWFALYRVSHASRDELEAAGSPGEWRAWLGLGFMLLGAVYLLGRVEQFLQPMARDHAAAVARNLAMLLVAWAVLSRVLDARWKRAARHDERDREIGLQAAGWGRAVLIVAVVAIAVMLGFSPEHTLQWATPWAVANLLVFALMGGWLAECAATVAMYWRGRRG